MRHDTTLKNPARGFTLIEALVALLVLSFGLLAIAGFHTTLSRSADLAKQRTEATRLAQQKMESLRAYAQVGTDSSTPHIVNYTDDVVSSTAAEVFTSNATFSRTWTVTAQPNEKWIDVRVAWTDRAGQPQEVQLLSVISKFDPQDIGALTTFVPGATSSERRPKNRNVNVPYPAVTLSNGTQSAFTPPPGNVIYVFDNGTGNIVQSCTPTPYNVSVAGAAGTSTVTVTGTAASNPFAVGDTVSIAGATPAVFNGSFAVANPSLVPPNFLFDYSVGSTFATATTSSATATKVVTLVEGIDLSTVGGLTCTNIDAYLLSGYVRFDTSNNPTGAEPSNVGSNNDTRDLAPNSPFTLAATNQSTANGTPAMTCYAQRQKVVTATTTAVSISSLSRSGSTVTVTASGHGLLAGDMVAINAVNPAVFVGAFKVTSVSGSTFDYTLPPPLPAATSGSGGTVTKLQRLTIPELSTVTGYTNVQARFVSYACVVTPVDHDLSASTPKRWWGKVTLNTDGTWSLGTTSTTFKVCRYSADFNGSNSISNSEHPEWYRGVTGALDSQNYLVIKGDQVKCPTDVAQSFGSPVNFSDDTTAAHQPSGEPSFQCLNSTCNGAQKSVREPANTGTDVTMD